MSDLSQYLSALVTITLDNCYNLTESTFFTVAKNCPLLEDISMVGMNLGGGGDGATDIVKNPRIKSLNLENNLNLSDECLAKVASLCPSLEVLVVSSCKGITEKGIADFFKSGSKIRKLRINECGGIMNIGNDFELSELDFLGAANSGLNDDGLAVIGNKCRGLRLLGSDNSGRCNREDSMGMDGEEDDEAEGELENNRFDLTWKGHVWTFFLGLNNIGRDDLGFADEVAWACSHRTGSSLDHTIFRLSLAASLCWIWRERNSCVFQHQIRTAEGLITLIEEEVRACLASWRRVERNDANILLAMEWRVST
ncbi:hypothetical protein C3L33_10378, partial [Rhododendron williamsianum]